MLAEIYKTLYRLDSHYAGRTETELEFDVGFDEVGKISVLSVRGWFLGGADIDLAWNDMMILQTGADQVPLFTPHLRSPFCQKLVTFCLEIYLLCTFSNLQWHQSKLDYDESHDPIFILSPAGV